MRLVWLLLVVVVVGFIRCPVLHLQKLIDLKVMMFTKNSVIDQSRPLEDLVSFCFIADDTN